MNTETLERPTTELTLPQRAAVALGAAQHEVELRALVKSSAAIITIKNDAGRSEAHSALMRLVKSRTTITGAGKAAREDATAFTKAVLAEERRLVAIIAEEEDRLQILRDEWDAARQAERDAKIAAERERVDAIQARITAIRNQVTSAIGKSSAEISAMIGRLVGNFDATPYEEFADQAKAARLEVLDQLAAAETAQRAVEIDAESKRQEAARLKAEQEEEAARIAADRLKLQQERALQAEQIAEQERIAKAERDAAQAELKAAQDKFNAEQAAFRAEQKKAEVEAARLWLIEADRIAAQRDAEQAEARRVIDDAEQVARDAAAALAKATRQEAMDRLLEAADRVPDDAAEMDAAIVSVLAPHAQMIEALQAAHKHITATSCDVTVLGQIERALDAAGEAV